MNLRLLILALFLSACSEAPLISPTGTARLNNPASMVLVPGTSLAVVVNDNVNLSQVHGSLVALDLSARSVLTDTAIDIPNFAGRMAIDTTRSRLYVPDRGHNGLLVYQYAVPGTGGLPISFTAMNVPDPADKTTNGVKTDENPFEAVLVQGTSVGDVIMTTNNISGTLSVISAPELTPFSLNPYDSKLLGVPLISAANFKLADSHPGKGANRIARSPDGRLLFITSTMNHSIYVIDTKDHQVEAMLDLSTLSATAGTRGMVVAPDGLAYIVHRGLNAVVVLDVSGITDNGIDYEVADMKLVDIIPVGKDPEAIVLTSDHQRLFVSNQSDNSVSLIDVATRTERKRTALSGVAPGEMVLDASNNLIYVLNFLSDDITVLDANSGGIVDTIE